MGRLCYGVGLLLVLSVPVAVYFGFVAITIGYMEL